MVQGAAGLLRPVRVEECNMQANSLTLQRGDNPKVNRKQESLVEVQS